MSDLAAWLLEQIDVDEQAARDAIADDCGEVEGLAGQYDWLTGRNTRVNTPRFGDALARLTVMFAVPARVLAECEAKRRIVEWHKSWPVLVETEPEFTHEGFALQLSKRIAWLTQQEYVQRFGTEPPTAPVLRLLASVYADRPGYDESWRP